MADMLNDVISFRVITTFFNLLRS